MNFKMPAILYIQTETLYVALMSPDKLWLNQTYGSGENAFSKNFKMAVMVAILDIRTE